MSRWVFGLLMLFAVDAAAGEIAEDESIAAVRRQTDGYMSALADRRCKDVLTYWARDVVESISEKRKKEEIRFCRKSTRRTKILGWTIESITIDGAFADVAVVLEIKTYVGWFRRETCHEGMELRLNQQWDTWLVDPLAGGDFRVEDSCDD